MRSLVGSLKIGVSALATAVMMTGGAAFAQSAADAEALIDQVAEAMGGRDAILAIHTLEADGYGMEAYFWGGGNISGDPDAVQKWAENPTFSAVWDFDDDRYRTAYRHNFLFPFGGMFGHSFGLSAWGIDGDVGYTTDAGGRSQRLAEWSTSGAWFKPDGMMFRRYESLTHPVPAVRAVLDGTATVDNFRTGEDGYDRVDLIVEGGQVTMAVDPETMLPRSVSWSLPHQNLGQLEMTTTFVGYQDWDGVQMPFTWSSRIDWRDTLIQQRMLDAYYVNAEDAPDIAAPDSVLEAELPPAEAPGNPDIQAVEVAEGIWHLTPGNHTLIEFSDHLAIFEMGVPAEQARATIAWANAFIEGKPLTQLIVSHHHFDHTRGFRAAIEAGLTVISHAGNEDILRDMASRPAPDFGDIVPNPEGGEMRFIPVDGHLRLEDETMTLDIYEVVKHNHMSDAVFVYAPESQTLIEGDLATPANGFSFWAEAYEDNLEHYGLEVTMVSPNHWTPMTHEETLAWIAQGVRPAMERCEEYDALGRNLPGCPPYLFRDWESRLQE